MVDGFYIDADGRDLDRAYTNTSSSFKRYVSRSGFGAYSSKRFSKDTVRDFGKLGFTEEQELAVFVSVHRENSQAYQHVFVWEHGWKFKHEAFY